MKDSLRLMEIYRAYLETTGDLVELLEGHCKTILKNNISQILKDKYREYRIHTQKLIENLNDDLHTLIRIDSELKEIEQLEEKKEK